MLLLVIHLFTMRLLSVKAKQKNSVVVPQFTSKTTFIYWQWTTTETGVVKNA